jgi:triacylglycerol lipase
MGGQTGRLLIQLLTEGSKEEQAVTPANQLSPLFAGNHATWLDSIFTISAPHNGTSLIYDVQPVLPLLDQLVSFLSSVQGDSQFLGYDFMLDQWGLARQPGESWSTFIQRVKNSKFATTKDMATQDLNPDGASPFNGFVKAQPGAYNFSVATLQTFKDPFTQHQIADVGMNPLLVPFATFIGRFTQNSANHVPIDSSWWPNDGVVDTNSMAGPTVNSTDIIVPYNGAPSRGEWNYLNAMNLFGHLDIIGWGIQDVRSWYRSIAAFLASLPQ